MHKTTSTDDKRLQNTLKRLGVNTIPGIEEVNIFMDQDIINFTNPKGGPRSLHFLSLQYCCGHAARMRQSYHEAVLTTCSIDFCS